MEIFKSMLAAGVPEEHVAAQVEQHIEALMALDPTQTESTGAEIDDALEQSRAFLLTLKTHHEG